MLEAISLWWQKARLRRKMDRVFRRREDPYDYRGSPYETARLAAMERALGGGSFSDVLEVGCAEGAFTARLADRGCRVTAVDVSAPALERARRRLAGRPVEFVLADIRDWAGAPQDLIVLADVLYYLDKPGARVAFEEMFGRVKSWLKPGGSLLLAHAFATPQEFFLRRGYRERFERLGLRLSSESELAVEDASRPGVSCLISVLKGAR